MGAHETRLTQLVRVIDTLVQPVIQTDPELLATWENVVALPRSSTPAGGVVQTPTVSTSRATPLATSVETGHPQQAAA
jgi:hypothetical protein